MRYPLRVGAARILLVDDDAATRRAVFDALVPPQYALATAAEGEEGLNFATRSLPHVILLSPGAPKLDLSVFVRALRTWPPTALTPVIFLASRNAVEDQILGFKLGADDFLPKPLDGPDLQVRVAVALKMREKTDTTLHPKPTVPNEFSSPALLTAFRGTLDQIGLPSLLSLIDMERKTGMLVLIVEPGKDKARLYFHQGRVVRAQFDHRERPRNADLVYYLLAWTQGKFEFRAIPVDTRDEINSPTARLLLEGARLIDEARRRPEAPATEN